jgi:hypothetical protein
VPELQKNEIATVGKTVLWRLCFMLLLIEPAKRLEKNESSLVIGFDI